MIGTAENIMRVLGIAAVACTVSSPLSAQEIGDIARGFAFATAHCAECHAVKPGEVYSPNPGARNFTSAAREPGMTGRALAVWLDTTHPTMPNFILRTEDRDNVIAYIMSLKPLLSK